MNSVLKRSKKKFVTYSDLINIPVKESNEPFQFLPLHGKSVIGKYVNLFDMKKKFPKIPVRLTVAKKLKKADQKLKKNYPHYQLVVTYGYRSPAIQKQYFKQEISKIASNKNYQLSRKILEKVHEKIAVPDVAGHPTGGAIDIILYDMKSASFLDFGSKIYDFKPEHAYAESPTIKGKARKNRQLLRSILMNEQFAPYNGEWWHFSYGDKEWAFYYKKEFAIYDQIRYKDINNYVRRTRTNVRISGYARGANDTSPKND